MPRASAEYGGCSLVGSGGAERRRGVDDLAQLDGRERRRPVGADLAGRHELVEHLDRLADRDVGIGTVHLVQVDVVDLQPAQRVLARLR